MKRLAALCASFALVLPFAVDAAKAPNTSKTYFRIGNPGDAVVNGIAPGTVLMGGSTDVDAAFDWLCSLAPGGDFLVIRASGTDAYNPYVQQLCPSLNSVATLIIGSTTAANSATVRDTIAKAEIVWIAGGDQSQYVTYWTGTAVQEQLKVHLSGGKPIGGTSAGMAVLTQFIYSALASQGATSTQSLADPYNRYITLARDFVAIPALANTIGETHFVPRDRMGRTLAFMCRIAASNWNLQPRAIAVDEETAVLIDGSGKGKVVGKNSAYFLAAPGPAEVCQSRTPLTYRNVAVRKVGPAGTFDVAGWQGIDGTPYTVTAEAGVLSSSQPGGSAY